MVEDHAILSEGVKSLLKDHEEFAVVGELRNGNDVLPFLKYNEVHLVILDLNLPGKDGISLAREIKQLLPKVRILVLTFYNKPAFVKEIAATGVEGYLLKNSSGDDIVAAMLKVVKGESVFSKEAVDTWLKSLQRQGTGYQVKLTKREKEVMILLAKAYTTNEVATKLKISAYTAETHRKNIMAKLKMKNVAELALYARDNGYLDLPEAKD